MNVPRFVAAVAVIWACLVTAATGAAVWQLVRIGEEREDRICESLDRFVVFLGAEADTDPERLEAARERLTVVLEC